MRSNIYNIFLFAFIIILSSSIVQAQSEIGFRLGLSPANDSHNYTESNFTDDIMFDIGFLLEFDLNRNLSFETGVAYYYSASINPDLYVMLKESFNGGGTIDQTSYLQIPVLFKWFPDALRSDKISGYLIGGINIASIIGSSNFNTSLGDLTSSSTSFFIDLGLGVELPLSNCVDLFLDFRYSQGLTNIINSDVDNFEFEQTPQRNVIDIGFKFDLGGCNDSKPTTDKKIVEIHKTETEYIPTNNVLFSGIVLGKNTNDPVVANVVFEDKFERVSPVMISTNIDGEFKYNLPPGSDQLIIIEAKGFLSIMDSVQVHKDNTTNKIERTYILAPITEGEVIRLNKVFFDFNKSSLKQESYRELNRLVRFLFDNQSIRIEISGHTDNIGKTSYNINLSEARAKAVANYIISQIKDKNRITYKGYGDTKPVDDNSTKEGRQNNRRVEFKILKK